jgi:hypothetical protein
VIEDAELDGIKIEKRQNRAIIAAEVRRFGHVINTDGVLGTHRSCRAMSISPLACSPSRRNATPRRSW